MVNAQEKEYQYYDKQSRTFHNAHFTYDAYHPDYLFRGMAGLQELDGDGNLLPKGYRSSKGPKEDMTLSTHATRGWDRTPWLSTSKSVEALMERGFFDPDDKDQFVAIFDGSQYTNGDNMYDISTSREAHKWFDYFDATMKNGKLLDTKPDGTYQSKQAENYGPAAKECTLHGIQPSKNYFIVRKEELLAAVNATRTYDQRGRSIVNEKQATEKLLAWHRFGEQTDYVNQYSQWKTLDKKQQEHNFHNLYADSNRDAMIDCWYRKDFSNQHLESIDFSDLDLTHFNFTGATLKNCTFNHTRLDNVTFKNAQVVDCTFSDIEQAQYLNFGSTDIKNSMFENSTIIGLACVGAHFDNCDIYNVTLPKAIMKNSQIDNCSASLVWLSRHPQVINNTVSNSLLSDNKMNETAKQGFSLQNVEIQNRDQYPSVEEINQHGPTLH